MDSEVITYLKNFFADSSEEEIANYLSSLDDTTQTIMTMLVKTNIQSQKAVTKLSQTKDQSPSQNIDAKQMIKDLKILRSSTYNANLYLVCQQIVREWQRMSKPLSRNQLFANLGREIPIKAFEEALQYGNTSTKISQVIHKCFQQFYRNEEIYIMPTDYGIELMELDQEYYSQSEIRKRFDHARTTRWFSPSKRKLFTALSEKEYTNSLEDKQQLGTRCNIHPDNVSRYITQFNQMGFISRKPSELDSKHFVIDVFDKEINAQLVF